MESENESVRIQFTQFGLRFVLMGNGASEVKIKIEMSWMHTTICDFWMLVFIESSSLLCRCFDHLGGYFPLQEPDSLPWWMQIGSCHVINVKMLISLKEMIWKPSIDPFKWPKAAFKAGLTLFEIKMHNFYILLATALAYRCSAPSLFTKKCMYA